MSATGDSPIFTRVARPISSKAGVRPPSSNSFNHCTKPSLQDSTERPRTGTDRLDFRNGNHEMLTKTDAKSYVKPCQSGSRVSATVPGLQMSSGSTSGSRVMSCPASKHHMPSGSTSARQPVVSRKPPLSGSVSSRSQTTAVAGQQSNDAVSVLLKLDPFVVTSELINDAKAESKDDSGKVDKDSEEGDRDTYLQNQIKPAANAGSLVTRIPRYQVPKNLPVKTEADTKPKPWGSSKPDKVPIIRQIMLMSKSKRPASPTPSPKPENVSLSNEKSSKTDTDKKEDTNTVTTNIKVMATPKPAQRPGVVLPRSNFMRSSITPVNKTSVTKPGDKLHEDQSGQQSKSASIVVSPAVGSTVQKSTNSTGSVSLSSAAASKPVTTAVSTVSSSRSTPTSNSTPRPRPSTHSSIPVLTNSSASVPSTIGSKPPTSSPTIPLKTPASGTLSTSSVTTPAKTPPTPRQRTRLGRGTVGAPAPNLPGTATSADSRLKAGGSHLTRTESLPGTSQVMVPDTRPSTPSTPAMLNLGKPKKDYSKVACVPSTATPPFPHKPGQIQKSTPGKYSVTRRVKDSPPATRTSTPTGVMSLPRSKTPTPSTRVSEGTPTKDLKEVSPTHVLGLLEEKKSNEQNAVGTLLASNSIQTESSVTLTTLDATAQMKIEEKIPNSVADARSSTSHFKRYEVQGTESVSTGDTIGSDWESDISSDFHTRPRPETNLDTSEKDESDVDGKRKRPHSMYVRRGTPSSSSRQQRHSSGSTSSDGDLYSLEEEVLAFEAMWTNSPYTYDPNMHMGQRGRTYSPPCLPYNHDIPVIYERSMTAMSRPFTPFGRHDLLKSALRGPLSREKSNLSKERSNLSRELSALLRDGTGQSREWSNVSRERSNLSREKSTLSRDLSNLSRERTNLSREGTLDNLENRCTHYSKKHLLHLLVIPPYIPIPVTVSEPPPSHEEFYIEEVGPPPEESYLGHEEKHFEEMDLSCNGSVTVWHKVINRLTAPAFLRLKHNWNYITNGFQVFNRLTESPLSRNVQVSIEVITLVIFLFHLVLAIAHVSSNTDYLAYKLLFLVFTFLIFASGLVLIVLFNCGYPQRISQLTRIKILQCIENAIFEEAFLILMAFTGVGLAYNNPFTDNANNPYSSILLVAVILDIFAVIVNAAVRIFISYKMIGSLKDAISNKGEKQICLSPQGILLRTCIVAIGNGISKILLFTMVILSVQSSVSIAEKYYISWQGTILILCLIVFPPLTTVLHILANQFWIIDSILKMCFKLSHDPEIQSKVNVSDLEPSDWPFINQSASDASSKSEEMKHLSIWQKITFTFNEGWSFALFLLWLLLYIMVGVAFGSAGPTQDFTWPLCVLFLVLNGTCNCQLFVLSFIALAMVIALGICLLMYPVYFILCCSQYILVKH